MAGIRTAPAFTASADKRVITLHLIDASGDVWAEDWLVPLAATAANIEAWAAAYVATSSASLYAITETLTRTGAKLASNAVSGVERNSIKDGINMLYPNSSTFVSRTQRVVAPVPATMNASLDIPVLTAAGLLDTLITATIAISTVADYFGSAQYTERRERRNNPRTVQGG